MEHRSCRREPEDSTECSKSEKSTQVLNRGPGTSASEESPRKEGDESVLSDCPFPDSPSPLGVINHTLIS